MKISKTLVFRSLVIIAGLVLISAGAVELYRYKATENLKSNTFSQFQIIKSAIVQPLWNMDRKSINQTIESILADPSTTIAWVRILESSSADPKPEILLEQKGPDWQDYSFESLRNNEDFQFWDASITQKGNVIGVIQIAFSVSEARQEISRISLFLSVGLLFFTAFSVSLFLMLHMRRLSNELQKQVEDRTRELDSQRMALVNSSRLASLGEMSAGIAHEINNPLAVIDGTLRLISRTLATDNDSAKIENYLAKISKMVIRITKIINGLRAFSRDGSQEPVAEFYVERFLADLSDLCHSNLAHKRIDIQFILESRDTTLMAREVQLSQVMINMINNSADAIENLSEKWIKVECTGKDENLVFAITDSGPGISSEIQKKMLQPFFTTKELGKGTGLGLSISIGIVESHGGTLTYCQGHPNTRFEITLKRYGRALTRTAA